MGMEPLTQSADAAAPPDGPPAALVQALWRHRFARILAEMTAGVEHSALSPALAHGGELACALLDRQGFTVAEHGDMLRAGALGPQVRAALAHHPALQPEQVLAVSDPWDGGSELGTLTLLTLLAGSDGASLGYLAVSFGRGDWAESPAGPPEAQVDLAAEALPLPTPGESLAELPPAVGPRYRSFHAAETTRLAGRPRTAEQEGWRLGPTLLTDAALQSLVHKQRDPLVASADIKAARGALRWGAHHLRALDKRHGAAAVRKRMEEQQEQTRAALAAALQRLPGGVYAFADSLDDDGAGASDLPIRVTVQLGSSPERRRLSFDFRESADATAGALNTVAAVVHAAVRCALMTLLPVGVAANDGLHGLVELSLRKGSLLDAGPDHAVAAGATETAQRVVDVVLGALSQALPQPLRAAGAGTHSALVLRAPASDAVASAGTRRLYLRESLAGGLGASPTAAGASGQHAPPGPRALSCELIEQRLPVRVLRLALRDDSGGGGVHSGGSGLVRELLLLEDLHLELCGERRRRPPYGLGGGGPGQIGRDTLIRAGAARPLPAKVRLLLRAGDILRSESPGGGGYGDPMRAAFFAALLA
jgi:N-methylhydantoinase B